MKIPNIRKRPWKNIDMMIIAACDIGEGVVCLLTLGEYKPTWTMDYVCWRSIRMMEDHK